jgi:membrane-associated phospholipid phosphatase
MMNLSLLLATRSALRWVAALCWIAFAAIAACVAAQGQLPGDRRVLIELHAHFGTSIDQPMRVVSDLTDNVALIGVVVVVSGVLLLRARWRDAALFVATVAVVLAANPLLKEVVGRPRPDVRPPPQELSPLSFPSGHAAGTAALAGALLFVVHGRRPRSLVVIIDAAFLAIVAFSLLVLTVHYPSDVVAAWLWAVGCVAFVSSLGASRSASST